MTSVKEPRSSLSNSAVFKHMTSCTCQVNLDDFTILYTAENEYQLNIAEALLITEQKPVLNRNMLNHGAALFLKL